MLPLVSAKEGETVTIANQMAGNMILKVKDSRIALGMEMARRIMY